MRRVGLLIAVLVVGFAALAFVAMPSSAQEPPPHAHMLVQRPEFGLINGVPHLVGIRKCVDLAANRALPLNAHHDHIHTGGTGVSFGGESGHVVVPTAPLTPWANCAEFEAAIPISLVE